MIYLDNSSTTQPCAETVEKVTELLTKTWGNPSSLHSLGLAAEQEVARARRAVARALGCTPEEIFFTSGGTEADNLALFGAAYARKKRGSHIVTTRIEHPAVLHTAEALEQEGFTVTWLSPDGQGRISPAQVREAIRPDTILVSMMAVNNEVGSLLPVAEAARAIAAKKAPALLHVDAVQAFGKIALRPLRDHIDLMTVSAHKIHGPKGVGALFVKKGVRLAPRVFGGGQERGLRPGTESAPLIAGFGAAVEALPGLKQEEERIRGLNQRLRARLAGIPGVSVHSGEDALPYILSLSACPVRAETMLHFLAARDIFVSTGSACAKGKASHVLAAMGLPREEIASSLRVSFSRWNTKEDVDAFAAALQEGLTSLCSS